MEGICISQERVMVCLFVLLVLVSRFSFQRRGCRWVCCFGFWLFILFPASMNTSEFCVFLLHAKLTVDNAPGNGLNEVEVLLAYVG